MMVPRCGNATKATGGEREEFLLGNVTARVIGIVSGGRWCDEAGIFQQLYGGMKWLGAVPRGREGDSYRRLVGFVVNFKDMPNKNQKVHRHDEERGLGEKLNAMRRAGDGRVKDLEELLAAIKSNSPLYPR